MVSFWLEPGSDVLRLALVLLHVQRFITSPSLVTERCHFPALPDVQEDERH